MTHLDMSVKFARNNVSGRRHGSEDFPRRSVFVNIADKIIFYRKEDGDIWMHDASQMDEGLWDLFANGMVIRHSLFSGGSK